MLEHIQKKSINCFINCHRNIEWIDSFVQERNFISIIDSSQDHCSCLVAQCLFSGKSSLTYLLFRIRNKFLRSVLGRICGSTIWFRDLLTLNNYFIFYEQCWPYIMVSIQNFFLGKNYVLIKNWIWTILLPYKKCVTETEWQENRCKQRLQPSNSFVVNTL